jgi:hypothetical protein
MSIKGKCKRRLLKGFPKIDVEPYDRVHELERMRSLIEETITEAEALMKKNDGNKCAVTSLLSSGIQTNKDGKQAVVSFPPPGRSFVRHPKTRSLNRISSLHLSRLNLNQETHERSGDPLLTLEGSEKNAVFSDKVPKCPVRKRSSERLVQQRFQEVLGGSYKVSNLRNAVWDAIDMDSERPKKKQSSDRLLDAASLRPKEGFDAIRPSCTNATWRI